MPTTNLRALIPVMRRSFAMSERFADDTENTLAELLELSGNLTVQSPPYTLCPRFSVVEIPADAEEAFRDIFELDDLSKVEVLRDTAEVEYPGTNMQAVLDNGETEYLSPSKSRQRYRRDIRHLFEKTIYALVFAANIARPGSMQILQGVVFQDGEHDLTSTTEPLYAFTLGSAADFAVEKKWPRLRSLTIKQVWDWMQRHGLYIGKDNQGKASIPFNALTYLFERTKSDDARFLFWAIVGLEALYNKPPSNIHSTANHNEKSGQQLIRKSQLVFGSNRKLKNRTWQLYDFRSRFVHGSVLFPPRFNPSGSFSFEYYDEIDDDVDLAVALLVATLQELVIRDKTDLAV